MINNVIITNLATDVLVSPDSGTYAGVGMFLCNGGDADEKLNIYAAQKDAGASTDNMVIKDLTIKKGETYEFSVEKFLLSSGERVMASGDVGNLVTATVTYTEI